MNFEFNKKNIILLTIFILVFALGIMLNNYRNPNDKTNKTDKIILVDDYSRFFTISNAGNKYIGYLKDKDKSNLLLLLSDDYIEINNITTNNILTKLTLLEPSEYTFEARKMYQEIINKNIIRYYVYGYLNKEVMDEFPEPVDYYLIIDLDIKNYTFEVTPYDGKIFQEEQ